MPPLRENQQSQQNQRKQPEAPADAIPVVTTDKLSKSFSVGGSQQHVLRNLDLAVDEGSFTVIMGPSGAGKSTLLYALSGLDRPTLGTVRLGGTRLTELKEDALARFRRGHCGFVFQQVHLLDSLSVLENLLAVGLLIKQGPQRRHRPGALTAGARQPARAGLEQGAHHAVGR